MTPSASSSNIPMLRLTGRSENNRRMHHALTDFLDEITRQCKFKYHFFEHYHMDRIIQKKYVLLYEQIIRLKL